MYDGVKELKMKLHLWKDLIRGGLDQQMIVNKGVIGQGQGFFGAEETKQQQIAETIRDE